jgi:hypothetical protein
VNRIVRVAASLWLAGCADQDCSLEQAVVDLVGTATYIDCGGFQASSADDAPHRAAHDCVVAAFGQQQAFVVRWYTQGIEGLMRHAYVGLNHAARYQVTELIQGYRVDAKVLPTTERSCSDLIDKGECMGPYISLCLQCVFVEEHTCEP